MNPNLLYRTKVYTLGSMEFGDGREWRDRLKLEFAGLSIIILDPYNHQFVHKIDESEEHRQNLIKMRQAGKFDELAVFCKEFRTYDLSCVDRSDFVIWYLDITIPTIGSVEEFTTAVKMKRPSYVVVKQGKTACPLWLFGMIPHNYIKNSLEEVIEEIKGIDNGEIEMDDRWRLFNKEIR